MRRIKERISEILTNIKGKSPKSASSLQVYAETKPEPVTPCRDRAYTAIPIFVNEASERRILKKLNAEETRENVIG